MLSHQGSLDRSRADQDVSTALPMPGKQTRVDSSSELAGPSAPGVATKPPENVEDAPGNAAPGAQLFEDDGLTWIQRNDGAFECVKASFRKQSKRHSVVDRTTRNEEWQRLDALQPAKPTTVQRKAAGTQGPANVHAAAAAGVRDASGALPYASAIQKSFGRHDIGGVKAAVGGAASQATAAIGATAYATGDRVAFGDAPDLHTAAHEAAHVVQQRSGVQLAGGVGSSGDRYEQHADRVADRVVAGGSAETLLDEMVGGGGSASSAVQRHDSPGHIGIGESVKGEGVTIHGIEFSPGQLSALADYVTTLDGLAIRFTREEIAVMHDLLVKGDEDTKKWTDATNGEYATEVLANEKHFAPSAGDGGKNFRDQFITGFANGLEVTASGDTDRGRLLGYGAEHYIQDAFSAGHQVAARDIEQEVDATVRYLGEATALAVPIAMKVYNAKANVIRCYDVRRPGKLDFHPIELLDFIDIAMIGAFFKGNAGIADGVRRFVHEQLETGVEVRSDAHPQPFVLLGDHDIGEDAAEEGVLALQVALHEGRELLGKGADSKTSKTIATTHFDRHCPTPTATGQATIRTALESGTKDAWAIIDAVAETMIDTIEDVMDTLVEVTKGIEGLLFQVIKKANPGDPALHPFPEIDPYDPEAPIIGQPVESPKSYIPNAPEWFLPEAPVQRSEDTATATCEPAPAPEPAAEPAGSRVGLGEAATTFPLLQEIAIPSPYGSMTVSASLDGTLDLAPDPEAGAAPAVEVGVGTGPEGASIDATNLLATLLGKELGALADSMSLKNTGELEYALGFEEVDLPGFGPITQKFQFQLVEITAKSLTKMPEVKFGTFTLTGTLAVPPQFDVGGSISITIKLEPNWLAIGRTVLAQTATNAAAAEVAAGEVAAGEVIAGEAAAGGAGLGAGPIAAGAVGALIFTRLVAEAYVRADGVDSGLEYAYVGGYTTGLASEIFQVNPGLPKLPQGAMTEQLTIRQYEGVLDAENALKPMSAQEKESIRQRYSYDHFLGSMEAELRLKIRG
ncbi:MAG TPA: DUF4157 domain-containing protein [Kofleriaceae bacterium]